MLEPKSGREILVVKVLVHVGKEIPVRPININDYLVTLKQLVWQNYRKGGSAKLEDLVSAACRGLSPEQCNVRKLKIC